MLGRLLQNHVLANLTFAVVLLVGGLHYLQLPREQDPSISYNWIEITTAMPGAAAEDVEKQITDVLEDAVRNVPDVDFVSSHSRESISMIMLRFEDIDDLTFDKRLNDLRREIQNEEGELPDAAETPEVVEITSANAFPAATLVISSPADDENLRWQAEGIKEDLERLEGVDFVSALALNEPELQVLFEPEKLEGLGITPNDLADTVSSYYRDVSAGTVRINREDWLVRVIGAVSDPDYLARLPVITARGEVPLGSLARVERGRADPGIIVRFQDKPAVMLAILKKAETNLLELVDSVNRYIEERNRYVARTGVRLVLVDDQTEVTRNALRLMQNNALVGLALVLMVAWAFLGSRIAFLTCIGIPFILAGTFWVLSVLDQTLNVTVLLGIVISLGMLVDDAVVVVEAIFHRLQQGATAVAAALAALREVAAPVTTAVLTTIATFLPLMLMPGILGKFMRVLPLVVTVALLISLIEAFWMLPAHITAARVSFKRPSKLHRYRLGALRWIRRKYTRLLLRVLRYPKTTLIAVLMMMAGTFGALAQGWIHVDFFANDPMRVFYVNVEMPPGTALEDTMAKVQTVEDRVRAHLRPGEARAVVGYAGQMFNEVARTFGDHYGQIMVGLNPRTEGLRDVDAMIEAMRADVLSPAGARKLSFLRMTGGPPTSRPISVKVRGDDLVELRAAVEALKAIMATDPTIQDITDDDDAGPRELRLWVNQDATRRAGLDPAVISRAVGLLVDGEVVASLQDRGETLDVRVRAREPQRQSLDDLLRQTLPLPAGGRIPLAELVHQETGPGQGNVRHYDFRRAITVEADIDKTRTNTVAANEAVRAHWAKVRDRYPGVNLDFSGELDDIQESIDALGVLFLFGVGLIYLILGTQFRSYFQPLMILTTVPMAFTGVVLGLLITGDTASLFTLYGIVALAGIAVNAAIVLISAANARLDAGMSVLHATVYAARRRVIPIMITSLTTIAGLFSLATGLAGHSLIWGPVATAIVWGLGFSTVLTLLMVPLLYRLCMGRSWRVRH